MKEKERDRSFVSLVEKVLRIFEAFAQHAHSAVTLDEITKSTELAKPTAYRLLYTLCKIGYVEKLSEPGKYQLAQKFYELGKDTLPYQRLTIVAKPFMNALLTRFGETIHIGVLENGLVTNIAVCESQNPYRLALTVGDWGYAHATAMGKCLLAHLSEQELEDVIRLQGLPKKTAATITNRGLLLSELEKVRREHVATNIGETTEGVICVGAPIFNHDGKSVAALSVSGPAIRMEQGLETIKNEVRNVACRLSMLLGYSPEKIERNLQIASDGQNSLVPSTILQ